jgi:hypothetical protein
MSGSFETASDRARVPHYLHKFIIATLGNLQPKKKFPPVTRDPRLDAHRVLSIKAQNPSIR